MNAPADLNLIKMEPQEVSTDVLLEKYAKGDESSIGDIHARVARALAEVEPADQREHWQNDFSAPCPWASCPPRICSAAGTDIQATLINCFVQPVGDAVTNPPAPNPASTPLWRRPLKPCAVAAA